MLAWVKAAIESRGSFDILVGAIGSQGVFLLLDLTISRKLSKAYFENGVKCLEGQLDK